MNCMRLVRQECDAGVRKIIVDHALQRRGIVAREADEREVDKLVRADRFALRQAIAGGQQHEQRFLGDGPEVEVGAAAWPALADTPAGPAARPGVADLRHGGPAIPALPTLALRHCPSCGETQRSCDLGGAADFDAGAAHARHAALSPMRAKRDGHAASAAAPHIARRSFRYPHASVPGRPIAPARPLRAPPASRVPAAPRSSNPSERPRRDARM